MVSYPFPIEPMSRSLGLVGVTANDHRFAEIDGNPVIGPSGLVAPQRAAQYVRMSTEHQQYSIANQKETIAGYAAKHGLEVVRTYSDDGKSGLALSWRAGLREMLADVMGGRADFSTVLVYDVSRWGRFQDPDESAHYEFVCRSAGVHIEYCAEPFRNDLSAASSLIKNLKRMMAGEFSRELSVKVFETKCQMARRGLNTGLPGAYGLRRMLVDSAGRQRGVLGRGEVKYSRSDRIVLVPGPPEELAVLRWIFRQATQNGKGSTTIARELNARGTKWISEKPWKGDAVRRILRNEVYIGNLVYNRRSSKLRGPKVLNPTEQWIRAEGVFKAVVKPAVFQQAQIALQESNPRMPEDLALAKLRALFAREGKLSSDLIDAEARMPTSDWYRIHFKSLYQAYARVGYAAPRDHDFVKGYRQRWWLLLRYRQLVAEGLQTLGVGVERERAIVLKLNGRMRLGVLAARARPGAGAPRWLAQIHTKPPPDWLLVARIHPSHESIIDQSLVSGPRQVIWLTAQRRCAPWTEEPYAHLSEALGRLVTLAGGSIPPVAGAGGSG